MWTKLDNFDMPFMNSNMSNEEPSFETGMKNMSVLWGCAITERHQVGMVSSESFNNSFYPAIKSAFSKSENYDLRKLEKTSLNFKVRNNDFR